MKHGDIVYSSKKSAGGKFSQQGTYNLTTTLMRPKRAQYRLYENMWKNDTTLKSALTARVRWLTNTIGTIEHPDKEIADFHNYYLKSMEDDAGRSFKDCLEKMEQTKSWAGSSVTEALFKLDFGALTLKDLVTYHPSTITYYADKKGRLVEGKESFDHYHKSGIWQSATSFQTAEKRLSLWKVIHLCNDSSFGNYYGYSILEPSYVWVELRKALVGMMAAGLDKLGHRVLWVRMPSYSTGETRFNPATQEEEEITSLRLVYEQFESVDGMPEVIFLPYQQEGHKPELGSESLQDDLGETFLESIDYADSQSIKHIIPPYLVSSRLDVKSDPIVRERQMELFSNNIEADRAHLTIPLIYKIFMPIQQWNFNRESAKIPPTFARVYSDRTEARLATMQMVKGLTESGWINPMNDTDYSTVMQMLRLGVRSRDKKDIQFIKDMLIEPRRKAQPRNNDIGPQGSGNPGRSTGNKEKQIDLKATKTS